VGVDPAAYRAAMESRGTPAPARTSARLAGRKAQASGESWEAVVATALYKAPPGTVVAHRIQNGARRVGPGGRKIIPLPQPYDYTGALRYPGNSLLPACLLPFAFDAKHCTEARFETRKAPPHQWRALGELALMGAAAGFLIHQDSGTRNGRPGRVLWLPVLRLLREGPLPASLPWGSPAWTEVGDPRPEAVALWDWAAVAATALLPLPGPPEKKSWSP
jgi:hypothetical protein